MTQGVHVTLGLVLIPVVLAKLWSVLPKLFEWPPARSVVHALERLSLLLLVGGAIFQLVTGVMNIQYFYAWPFGFYRAHFYGAWVFMAAFVVHTAFRMPRLITALLAPRGQDVGDGAAQFQVNKTAAAARIARVDQSWRLTVTAPPGPPVSLSRAELLSLPQHTARLSIACVEGWSTGRQTWSGVRLADLATLAGAPAAERLLVESLQAPGLFTSANLAGNQIQARDALLALRVNGVDLPLDHGYPARVVVPALPGVHNTKWVARLTFFRTAT